jgi:DNA repair photolyase
MRWDNLKVDAEESRTLPGYREPATVRTFNAPEALDSRFYEVRAKSALNKVPNASRMPFRWTINPYRGCAHACVFCMSGDTEILMADGATKPLADIRPGERIYGTTRVGPYRGYTHNHVLAHWSAKKPAYRVVLEDDTELIASGDHRFLTDRGWKFVAVAEGGALRRSLLTTNSKLMGTGAFARRPDDTEEYRGGYLCGMVRGDAHRSRPAPAELDGLRRTRGYLADLAAETEELALHAGTKHRRPVTATSSQPLERVRSVQGLIRWPRSPSVDWCKGFLAGIFDAEGGCGDGILRISNSDPEILDRTSSCLRKLGFSFTLEDARHAPLETIRLLGGLVEQLRFFHTVDPAIRRRRSIAGRTVETSAALGVVAIEPVGEMELYDITTGTGDFIANGVVSHNCFARPTHTYLDFDAGRDFDKEIVVKVNVPEVARAELMRPSWKHEHVALGTNTDPYQWVEGRYRLMPGIWEAMRDSGTPSSVLTKSPLLLRDIELMKEVHEAAGFAANLSIPTLDEKAWRASEPHTPHPRKRIEAVAELNRAGIPTGVLVAPLMPGINDSPEQVERILELCGEAGATNIGGIPLHLRGEVRGIFMDWLRSYRPDLLERYEELYTRGAYVGKAERERIAGLLRRGPGRRSVPGLRSPGRDPITMPEPRPAREPAQTKLF